MEAFGMLAFAFLLAGAIALALLIIATLVRISKRSDADGSKGRWAVQSIAACWISLAAYAFAGVYLVAAGSKSLLPSEVSCAVSFFAALAALVMALRESRAARLLSGLVGAVAALLLLLWMPVIALTAAGWQSSR